MALMNTNLLTGLLALIAMKSFFGCNSNSPSPNNDARGSNQSEALAVESNTGGAPYSGIQETVTEFETFSFVIPARWTSMPPDRGKTKALLVLTGGNPGGAMAMIKVDVGKSAVPDLRTAAESFAKSFGGTVDAESVTLDGVEAFRVTTDSKRLEVPSHALLLSKNEMLTMVMGAGPPEADIKGALSKLIDTWKWK